MPKQRREAVKEIRRILKPTGHACLSLGIYAPLTLVGRAEWKKILESFKIERSGDLIQPWALVSKKDEGKKLPENYEETAGRQILAKLVAKIG